MYLDEVVRLIVARGLLAGPPGILNLPELTSPVFLLP